MQINAAKTTLLHFVALTLATLYWQDLTPIRIITRTKKNGLKILARRQSDWSSQMV